MKDSPHIHSFSDGNIRFWVEQGTSIHIKAATAFDDPVELSEQEAKELALALLEAVKEAES